LQCCLRREIGQEVDIMIVKGLIETMTFYAVRLIGV